MAENLAATRGCPSFVWRAGQERRLAMVRRWAPLEDRRVLDVGCGLGMYTLALQRYTPHVYGVEVELDRAGEAQRNERAAGVVLAPGEALPLADASFDLVFSHEVLEHVRDDRACAAEMVRVTRTGGRLVIFVPNRWWPFETHGFYWRGRYRFGNVPLINYLPDPLRNRLAPHVRTYTGRGLRRLFADQPVRLIHHGQVYPGFDNLLVRRPRLGRAVRRATYSLEKLPILRGFGLSHLLVMERT